MLLLFLVLLVLAVGVVPPDCGVVRPYWRVHVAELFQKSSDLNCALSIFLFVFGTHPLFQLGSDSKKFSLKN